VLAKPAKEAWAIHLPDFENPRFWQRRPEVGAQF